jgi:16S rRNA (guanine527-N7)-methyltransferase
VRQTTTPGAAPGRPREAQPIGGCLDRPREPLPTRVETLPELPGAFDDALDAGLRDLGLELAPEARRIIGDHVRLLLAWNAAINLTSIRDPASIAIRHVVDSLAAVPLLRARRVGGGKIDALLDLGSGGGFPGVPLAVVVPLGRVALVESVGKKAAFLATAVEATGLAPRVTVAGVRAEDLARDRDQRERWPVVTVRAVGRLDELVELAFPLLVPGGMLVAWKGNDIVDETATALRAVAAMGGGGIEALPVPVRGLEGHRLVVVTKRGRTADGFPRDPAVRRRRPW